MPCATGSINVYVSSANIPWNRLRAAHLYRRMAFGATHQQINAALTQTPAAVVDQIVNAAMIAPLPDPPVWYDWTREPIDDYADFNSDVFYHRDQWGIRWITDMFTNSFRERMALFWINHFVTVWNTYLCSAYLYEYHKLLQVHALGNFKNFVHAVGITPAMLVFLNGNLNTKDSPNENYARELFELFTLGQNNGYTQEDIQETARALTGWQASTDSCAPVSFDDTQFDDGSKTIFGQTANFDYDGLIDLLFAQRSSEIAHFICGRLYRHFVAHDIDDAIVADLAQTFIANNFEIAPVVRQLFKSEHFFDSYNIGHLYKSPIENFLNFFHTLTIPYDNGTITGFFYASVNQGQLLFEPPNVAGWPGHRFWINETTLTYRWQDIGFFIQYFPYSVFDYLIAMIRDVTNDTYTVDLAARTLVDFVLVKGLPHEDDYDVATVIFKGNIPQNYFDDGSWNLQWDEAREQVRALLYHLVKLPEYQLN